MDFVGVFLFFFGRIWNSLELAEPWIGHDGAQDGCQVAQSHKGVVDSGGEVIVPLQEVLEVQNQHGCRRGRDDGGHGRKYNSPLQMKVLH